jgi:hypothetical protein
MGKLLQGILGGISGSVGNVVGSSWKGIPVIKAKPLSVANPKTAGQIAQRTKMTNIVAFAGEILSSVIKPLWDRFAQQMSGYNDFISTNIDLFANPLPSPAADLQISKGKMAATPVSITTITDGDTSVVVTWTDDSGTGLKLASDLAYVVCTLDADDRVKFNAGTVLRSAETATVSMGVTMLTGDVVNAYLAFKRADGTVVSDTSTDADTV